MKLHLKLLTVFVATALSGVALAHDFWIEPSNYRPARGARVDLDLKVGELFVGESVERNDTRIVSFQVFGATGDGETVLGVDRRAPAGLWRPKADGLHLIGYRSNTVPLELEAEKFEHYLKAEGLEHVIEARRARGDSRKKGLEIYSRSAKSLVWVGEAPAASSPARAGFDRRIGLTLEIVPEKDPVLLRAGDELPVRVWFRDAPLQGALLGCMAQADAASEVRLRTDEEGRARFRLTHAGPTLLRVCWMTPAPAGSAADWESTWGSLTWTVAAAPTPAPAPTPNPAPTPAPKVPVGR